MNLLSLLNWRYATKKMDPARAVPQDKVDHIIEATRLTPTSSGLQPYELIVVTNPEVRAKIREIAWNQAQITDGSHLLVFAAWDNYTVERINHMFDWTNEVRGFKNEGWENYRQMLLANYPKRDAEVNFQHAARQAYIGLGVAMVAAAEQGVGNYEVRSWTALLAPAGTPRAVVERLNATLRAVLADDTLRTKLEEATGGEVKASAPEDVQALVDSDVKRWQQLVRDARIQKE